MAKINKKAMSVGAVLALSFLGILIIIFSPIFGDGKSGLVFSDDLFNKLSKGSSYFIPKVMEANTKFKGRAVATTVKISKPELIPNAVKILNAAGAEATVEGEQVKISADLGAILTNALIDADDMFKNNGQVVADRYGMDETEVLVIWWNILSPLDKQLKKEGMVEESKIVSDVMKKAVETAYNFYKIDAAQVTDHAGLMSGLLIFYVVYTMWWGFAIFYLFEGFGLTMKKAKVKKEV